MPGEVFCGKSTRLALAQQAQGMPSPSFKQWNRANLSYHAELALTPSTEVMKLPCFSLAPRKALRHVAVPASND